MKRALLKLISVFQIVAGLAGIYAVGISVLGMATAEVAKSAHCGKRYLYRIEEEATTNVASIFWK